MFGCALTVTSRHKDSEFWMSIENRSKLSMLKQRSGQGRCPRCGKSSMVLDMSTGEQVCTNCGFVVKDNLEEVGPSGGISQRNKVGTIGAGLVLQLA